MPSIATLCRPDSKNGKTGPKLIAIGSLKNVKKGLRPVGHRSVELHFGFCFQQNAYGGWGRGWGTQAEGRKNRRHRESKSLRRSEMHFGWSRNPSLCSGLSNLRIDLHHVKRRAYHVDLGDAGSKRVCRSIEDIEFRALDDVNNVAAGDRLHSCDVKVLAER